MTELVANWFLKQVMAATKVPLTLVNVQLGSKQLTKEQLRRTLRVFAPCQYQIVALIEL